MRRGCRCTRIRRRGRRASIPVWVLVDREAVTGAAELGTVIGAELVAFAIVCPHGAGAKRIPAVAFRPVLGAEVLVCTAEVGAELQSHEVARGCLATQGPSVGAFGVTGDIVEGSVAHCLRSTGLSLDFGPAVGEERQSIGAAADLAGISWTRHGARAVNDLSGLVRQGCAAKALRA